MKFNKTWIILILRKRWYKFLNIFTAKFKMGMHMSLIISFHLWGKNISCFVTSYVNSHSKAISPRKVYHLWKKWLLFEIKQMLLFMGKFSFGSLLLGPSALSRAGLAFNLFYGNFLGNFIFLVQSSPFLTARLKLTLALQGKKNRTTFSQMHSCHNVTEIFEVTTHIWVPNLASEN